MSISRFLVDEHGNRVPSPDSDVRRQRPQHYTRRNAAGEEFHTYVDPDLWPATAKADEAQWQLEHGASE